ncbi:MAG: Universal stress protein family, partial [Myxococcaceae bacterium]|nr:Universal stress protein family [Myxococcaceae bacterium]
MGILCATNFSPEALTATTVAAELARQRNEELALVFVLPGNLARTFGREVLTTAEEALELEAARIRALGAAVTPSVLIGKLPR